MCVCVCAHVHVCVCAHVCVMIWYLPTHEWSVFHLCDYEVIIDAGIDCTYMSVRHKQVPVQ